MCVPLAGLTLLLLTGSACRSSRRAEGPAVEIVPSADIAPAEATEGDALTVTYRWTTASGYRPLGQDYRAFVHIVDAEGAIIFTDDHQPLPPTSAWKPGHEYAYTRTVFAPRYYPLRLRFRVGLFEGRERLALRGTERGGREYEVGGVTVATRPKEQEPLRFGEEWTLPTSSGDDPLRPSRWMRQLQGTILVKNPCVDSVLVFSATVSPALVGTWPVLEVRTDRARWSLPARDREPQTFKLRVPAWALGSANEVPLLLHLSGGAAQALDPGSDTLSLLLHGIALAPQATAAPGLLEGAAEPETVASPQ